MLRTERLSPEEITRAGGLPVTTRIRTAFDLGRHLDRFEALARLDALMWNQRFDVSQVALLADERPRARGVVQLRELLPLVDGGAASPRESAIRLLLHDNGFPRPETQIPAVDGARPVAFLDLGWPEYGVAVEYDGDHHRKDRRQYVKDIARLRMLEAMGWIVIRVIAEDRPEAGSHGSQLRCGREGIGARPRSSRRFPRDLAPLQPDPQLAVAVEIDQTAMYGLTAQMQIWIAVEQLPQCGHRLVAGQRGAEADVDAAAEGHVVSCVRPRDVEAVGLVEHLGIPIGASEQQHHRGSLRDGHAGDLGVAVRPSRRHLYGAVEAQHLLHRRRPQTGVLSQQRELVGMVHQCDDAVADQVDRRLHPRPDEQRCVRPQDSVGQPALQRHCAERCLVDVPGGSRRKWSTR